MRTTITIGEDLLKEAMEVSGKSRFSEAIVTSLHDYLSLKKRLDWLEELFLKKLPHKYRTIKKQRRKGQWSS